ncbi:hypothetical protein C8F01DRAFT_1079884 [Mycena amicta]|nr:hypothetical protein C8F01DRAFT_1079884 [Mycena amicta]
MQLTKSFPESPAPSPVVSRLLDAKLGIIRARIIDDSAIATAGNSTALEKRSVYYETCGPSPTTVDAIAASRYIQSLGSAPCCQNNLYGSQCTTMWTSGTAAVGVCNTIDNDYGCGLCSDAGNGLLDISNTCSSGGRCGGSADYGRFKLILFHS